MSRIKIPPARAANGIKWAMVLIIGGGVPPIHLRPLVNQSCVHDGRLRSGISIIRKPWLAWLGCRAVNGALFEPEGRHRLALGSRCGLGQSASSYVAT